MVRGPAVVAFSLALALWSAEALGQQQETLGHLQRGEQAFARGDFESALEAFEAAYEESPQSALLYNIAMCQWELDRIADSVNSFRRYREEDRDSMSEEDQAEIDRILSQLRPRHGDVRFMVEPPGTVLLVDGRVVGRAPLARPVAVTPGEHDLATQVEGAEPSGSSLFVDAGETVTVRLDPPETEPEGPPDPGVEGPPEVEEGTGGEWDVGEEGGEPEEEGGGEERPRRPLRWWFWAPFGVTLASAVAMFTTGGLTLNRHATYISSDQLDVDAYESGHTLGLVTDVLLGVTLGTATITLVALIVHNVLVRRDRRAEGEAQRRGGRLGLRAWGQRL